jgi:hypothetical protein
MKVIVAKQTLDKKEKPVITTLEKIQSEMAKEKDKIFYFDGSNSHKTMLDLIAELEKDYSVNFSEIKFKPADEDYIYQMHLIK